MSISSSGPHDAILDARGLMCPMPVLKAKKALRDVKDGTRMFLSITLKNPVPETGF